MTPAVLRGLAARANAELCAAVHRTHGHESTFTDDLWSTSAPPLPLYPNAVTLSDRARTPALVQEFLDRFLHRGPWGLKDSFAALDLTSRGFGSFDGFWLARTGAPAAPGLAAEPIADAAGLSAWEDAWRGEPSAFRQFPARLLDEPGFTFWAFRERETIVSGCLTNQTAEAVGFSNVFGPSDREAVWWRRNVDFLSRQFRGQALLGWEREPDVLDPDRRLERLGPLRVWLSPARG